MAVQVFESHSPDALGTPYFSCFTQNNISRLATCNDPSPTFIGNTGDGSSGNPKGELWFVYRRYYDALATHAPVTLGAATMGFTVTPPPDTYPIMVEPPIGGTHTSDLVVDCPTNVVSTTTWAAANGQLVASDTNVAGPSGTQVICTVVVFDTDLTFYPSGNPD